jgi:GTP cyclohydrolase I
LEAVLWKYSRQLQLQERLATQVADALEKFFPHLDGVFVCMSAYHHCMRARGAEKTSAKTLSVIKRGIYEDHQTLSMDCIKRFHDMNSEKNVLVCERC